MAVVLQLTVLFCLLITVRPKMLYALEGESVKIPFLGEDKSCANIMGRVLDSSSEEVGAFDCSVGKSQCSGNGAYKNRVSFISENRSVEIHALKTTDSGVYKVKCAHSDKEEAATLVVLERLPTPRITYYSTVSGTDIAFVCNVPVVNGCNYTWYKDKQPILEDEHYGYHNNNAILIIRNATVMHSGEYSCEVNNPLSMNHTKTSLTVKAPESPHKRHHFLLIPAIFLWPVCALIVYFYKRLQQICLLSQRELDYQPPQNDP
ncbi:cell adhesion molecule CEACAM6-like isoform X1 [Ascaphus truei]|uniref:cell adhesion molecule CEACAM6-like isoform X1 n=1 Tax=Ascaphus truei TaxID=8439 RepID=UPI003F5A2C47